MTVHVRLLEADFRVRKENLGPLASNLLNDAHFRCEARFLLFEKDLSVIVERCLRCVDLEPVFSEEGAVTSLNLLDTEQAFGAMPALKEALRRVAAHLAEPGSYLRWSFDDSDHVCDWVFEEVGGESVLRDYDVHVTMTRADVPDEEGEWVDAV